MRFFVLRPGRWRRPTSAPFLVLLALFLSLPADGQLVTGPLGDDPAYWWTLSDTVSPHLLREELQSRERSRQRLQAAIDAGLYDDVPPGRLRDLNYFNDGRLTPELQPMWEAFHVWAMRFEYRPRWRQTSRQTLVEHGMSAAGVELVTEVSMNHWKAREEVMEEVGPDGGRFWTEVLEPAEGRLGRRDARALLKVGQLDRFASISGKSPADVEELFSAWLRDPSAEASISALKELRRLLSAADWQALRATLLATTARSLRHEGYADWSYR